MLLPRQRSKLARGAKDKEHAMSQNLGSAVAVIGIDIGKNSFQVVELDRRGVIVLRCTKASQPIDVMGNVWTVPAVQEESDYQRSVRVRSCIRPHMMVSPSRAEVGRP